MNGKKQNDSKKKLRLVTLPLLPLLQVVISSESPIVRGRKKVKTPPKWLTIAVTKMVTWTKIMPSQNPSRNHDNLHISNGGLRS